jgi:large subunit ribosomal protein L31
MKKDIHPKFNVQAKVTCACGNSFTVGSTRDEISVEICSACHPFFTGQEKVMDTAGRVDKFKKRQAAASTAKTRGKSKGK